jgi:DNA polymerase gamma 1
MQFDPTLDEEEAKQKANKMYAQTKGKKVKVKTSNLSQETEANEFDANSIWTDGTESEMFNKLEEIARSRLPKTPVLGSTITKTLEPVNVADEVS